MKKILSIFLTLSLLVTLFASIASVAGAVDTSLNSYDVFEDWEDYKLTNTRPLERTAFKKADGTDGDFVAGYEYGTDQALIVEDPSNSGYGNVLYLNNKAGAGGTYLTVGYLPANGNNLNAHDFTLTYDLYVISGGLNSSPWTGVGGRYSDPGVRYIQTYSTLFHIQNGKGESRDTLRNGNTATQGDIYYRPFLNFAMNTGSAAAMTPESGINKSYDNWYKTEGGDVADTWYNVRFEARGDYFALYMREAGDPNWYCLATAYEEGLSNSIYSGSFAFTQCCGEYCYDNIQFISEDGNDVTTTVESVADPEAEPDVAIPTTAGTAYSRGATAGDNSEIELIMSGYDGYTFGRWYTDEAMTQSITPVSFKLQKFVEDMTYAKYEWRDVTDETAQISSYEEMEAVVDEELDLRWNEYYSGSNYRLIIRTDAATDGFDYYGEFIKQKFTVSLTDDGNGTITGENFTDVGDGVLENRIEIGQSVTLLATPNPGYQFAGWYEQVEIDGQTYVNRLSDSAEFVYTHTTVGPVSIQAVFVSEAMSKHTVNLTSMITAEGDYNYGSILAGGGSFFYGEEISLMVTENEGFSFLGFYVEEYHEDNKIESLIPEVYLTIPYVVQGDVNIIAVYEIETYRVRIIDGLGGEERIELAQKGSSIVLTAAPAPKGYTFSGWTVGGTMYEQNIATRTVAFDATSRTIFAEARYTPVTNRIRVTAIQVPSGEVDALGKPEMMDVIKYKITNLSGSTSYRYGDKIVISTEMLKEGYCVSQFTVKGADATLNEDGTLSFTMGDEAVTIRIESRTIDVIAEDHETLMYWIFVGVGLLIVFALLFANSKDKRDQRQ